MYLSFVCLLKAELLNSFRNKKTTDNYNSILSRLTVHLYSLDGYERHDRYTFNVSTVNLMFRNIVSFLKQMLYQKVIDRILRTTVDGLGRL